MDFPHSAPTQGHVYEEEHHMGLHAAVDDDEQQHQEKKPMLKKVKEKAKKIKNTIGKKVQGHEDDQHQEGDDHDGYEEEEEEDELETDPEVHGVPTYESVAVLALVGDPRPAVPVTEGTSLRKITGGVEEDPAAPKARPRAATDEILDTNLTFEGGDDDILAPVTQSFEGMFSSDEPQTRRRREVPEQENPHCEDQSKRDKSYASKLSSATGAAKEAAAESAEYGKRVAAAVYEKATEAGAKVVEKVNRGGGAASEGGGGGRKTVRELLAEKLKPGEEEKALSEVISEALQKIRTVASEEKLKEVMTGSSGAGVAEKVRGAVASLFGKGGGGGPYASLVAEKQAEASDKRARDENLEEEDVE